MSKRKRFTPEEKVAIVRRHLVEKVPISDLCDELGTCERREKSGTQPCRRWSSALSASRSSGSHRRNSLPNNRQCHSYLTPLIPTFNSPDTFNSPWQMITGFLAGWLAVAAMIASAVWLVRG